MNIHKITRYLLMLCTFTFLTLTAKGQDGEPLRLAVAGVSHRTSMGGDKPFG